MGRTRPATPWRAAFSRAFRTAPGEMSVATTRAAGTSAARVTAIAPLPVPTSSAKGRAVRGAAKGGHGPFRQPLRLGTRDERVGGEQELPSEEIPRAENVLQRLAGPATRDQREQPHLGVADLIVHRKEEPAPGDPGDRGDEDLRLAGSGVPYARHLPAADRE